jgi:hypothetical protein
MKKHLLLIAIVFGYLLNIDAQITATSTGGGSGTYTTLKGAFDKINDGTLTGDVTLQVTASTSETATASLSASGTGSASYTSVLIYPTIADLSIQADGTLPASSHLIVLDGADNVTIDGSVGQSGTRNDAHSLTIASTSLTAATIVLQTDASTNTVKNCILKGNATSSKGIAWIASSTTLGNNSNLIENNLITNNGTRPLYAFYASNNTLTAPNTNNTIKNNDFKDCLPYTAGCMAIFVAGHASSVISTGWTISGNSFYETVPYTTTNGASAAINFINFGTSGTTSTGNNNVISGNYFGGTATHCGGGTFTKTSSTAFANNFSGINVYSITGTTTSIQNNTFQKFNWTNNVGSSNWRAIDVYGTGSFNIGTETGNTIGDNTTTGSIVFVTNVSTAVNSTIFGIQIGNTAGTTICKNNKIGSITASNLITAATNVSPITAITKSTGTGVVEISNNFIGSLNTANSITSALSSSGSETTGIKCYSNDTGNKIENNTIANLATGGTTGLVNGVMTGSTGTTTVNANLIHSLFSSSNSNGAQITGIYLNTTTNTICTNNIITLSAIQNGTANTQVCGFQEQTTTASTKLYHNTVYIYGAVDAGTRRSACYYSTITAASASNRDIRNNIFINVRTGGGSHSAINFANITGTNATILSNNNNLYSATASSICIYNNTAKTLAQWQATALPVTGATYAPDANSVSTNPTFTNASGTLATDFKIAESLVSASNTNVSSDFGGTITRSVRTLGAWETIKPIAISAVTDISALTTTPLSDLVVSSNTLTISQPTEVNSITVAPGAKLTLNSGQTLAVAGGISLQNTADATASFVDSRTDIAPTAIAGTVQQAIIETNRNWYVAVPVSGQTNTSITLSGASIVKRNEASSSWTTVTGSLTAGVGYIAIASATSGTSSWSLSGNLNSGKVDVLLTRSGSSSAGFNLVGNPYPSYLNWEQVLNLNATNAALVQPSIWYRAATYNNGLSKFDYTFNSYNSAGRVSVPTSTSGYIPPMQAFWVRANYGGTLSFTNDMRSHGDGASNKLKAPVENAVNQSLLRLQISNTVNSDETVVYFNANAQNTFDKFDTPKMFESATATIPEIYTQIDAEKLVINGMQTVPYETEIPIGFVTKQAGDFSISASEFSNFEIGTRLILKDKLFPTQETELTPQLAYSFSAPITAASANRFSLLFRVPGVATGINLTEKLNAQVFVNAANQISITAPENTEYSIFNTVGQVMAAGKTTCTPLLISEFEKGIYIVKISKNGRELSTRIIIK